MKTTFGELVKRQRIAIEKTLRQFCADAKYDPSNWSKIERGINPPPDDPAVLENLARQLCLRPNTEEWQEFMDQAAISRGQIPTDIMQDEELMGKLPVFFRTVRGAELNDDSLNSLLEKIRRAHSPDAKSTVSSG